MAESREDAESHPSRLHQVKEGRQFLPRRASVYPLSLSLSARLALKAVVCQAPFPRAREDSHRRHRRHRRLAQNADFRRVLPFNLWPLGRWPAEEENERGSG